MEDFPLEASCPNWIELLKERELYRAAGEYAPKPGDVIFFDWDQPADAVSADHVGLVVEQIPETGETPAQIRTIEGNSTEQVEYNTYNADDVTIIGYGELPKQVFYCSQTAHYHVEGCYDAAGEAVCGMKAHIHSKMCWDLSQNFELNGRALECDQEHEHTDACYGDAVVRFLYQDDAVSMNVTVVSSVGIPKGTQLDIVGLSDEDYASYVSYAEENSAGELAGLTGYRFRFLLAGEEIELEDAQITVELTLKEENADDTVETAEAEDGAAVIRQAVSGEENVLLYTTRAGASETGDGTDGENSGEAGETQDQPAPVNSISVLSEENGTITSHDLLDMNGQSQTVTLSLGSGRSIALASSTNPEFTVQFYADIVTYQYSETEPSGKVSLPIIDTRGDGDATDGDYGYLPKNTGSTSTTGTSKGILYLHLDPVSGVTTTENPNGSNKLYTVHTEHELREIYVEDQYTYSAGMGMENIDKLQDNTSYTLVEVRVYHADKDGYTAYTENLNELKFTNNSGSTDGSVYISDGAVVRLVYDTTEGGYNNAANIFDYDITTTRHYTTTTASGTAYDTYAQARAKATNVYMRTSNGSAGVGINSAWLSSSGNRANLAFGNSNTGVPYQSQSFNGYYLNQFNTGGYKGCHFGLVQDYNIAEDRLIYADGLRHQALFNDEAYYRTDVAGKTSYYRNSLNFIRTGDTYVLAGVNSDGGINGIQDTKLNYFCPFFVGFSTTTNSCRTFGFKVKPATAGVI